MATIPSYPQATPGPEDLLLGINIVAEGGVDAPKTRTFTIGSIVDLVETYNVAQNLQQVTDIGNAIVLPSNKNRAIDILLPDLVGVASKGIFVTIEAQTGTYPNPDAYVARIKGQNPGSLPNFISGFYAVATGADNYSVASEHNIGAVTSTHFYARNETGVTSDFANFYTNVNVFKIDYLGNVTAAKFVKQGGTPTEFLMADGSVSNGGGGATNLSPTQTATNFTINSDTGTDATIPLGNGALAGATLNNYTTAEKNKLGAISGTNTGDNATNTQYSGLAASKQDTLQNTVNIKSINGDSLLGSGNLTISGGGSSSQSAYTILANNTNAAAVPTEKVYKEVAQQSLSGTGMTATGGSLPSGLQSHSYRWSQVGNLVTVRITLEFQNSGICDGIYIPFANMPDIPQIPQIPPSIFATSVGQVITHGAGNLAGTPQFYPSPVGFGTSAIIVKTIGTPNTYAFCVGRETDPYYKGFIHIQYYI